MFNLAGKKRNTIAPDLPEYIMNRDYVAAALLTARDLNAGEDEWSRFFEELKQQNHPFELKRCGGHVRTFIFLGAIGYHEFHKPNRLE